MPDGASSSSTATGQHHARFEVGWEAIMELTGLAVEWCVLGTGRIRALFHG
jgi:hypothetical protein